jgi:hypothetical protein
VRDVAAAAARDQDLRTDLRRAVENDDARVRRFAFREDGCRESRRAAANDCDFVFQLSHL